MKKAKKLIGVLLCLAMIMSMVACGNKDTATEDKAASKEDDAAVTEDKGAEDEDAAWQKEPYYGKKLYYWIGAGCTAACGVAEAQGLFKDAGLDVEGFKGESDVEAIGTDKVQIAIGHIAKATVPATNGMDVTFVGSAHLLQGCKGLYVLADSKFNNYQDLKGESISVPNGIGASDYNITARLLIEAGMDPLNDVTLTPVEQDACVQAMQNNEIQAALLGDSFAYPLVQQGVLRKVESANGNSTNELCCIIMMNPNFIKENPITAEKLASCVKKALKWMGENPEDSTKLLIDLGLNNENYDMNLELNKLMSFGQQSDEYATEQMKQIIKDYIDVGLITSTDDADAVAEKLWQPIGSAE